MPKTKLIVLAALTTLMLGVTSCSSKLKNQQFEPIILGDGNIVNKQTQAWLKSYDYPKGFAFMVRTITSLPEKYVGVAANEYFEADIKQCPEDSACKKRGVYIIVSQSPKLIQVRTGSEISLQSNLAGITSGSTYVDRQNAAYFGDLDSGLIEMVTWLSGALPKSVDIPWYKQLVFNDLYAELYLEFNKLSLPTDGFYGAFILKPFIQARIFELRYLKSWWLSYVLAGILVLLLKALINRIITPSLAAISPKAADTIGVILAIAISLGMALPSAASAVFLSGSRMEDQIALRASGIHGISAISFSAELFSVQTGILLALTVVGVRILKGFALASNLVLLALLPAEKQRELYAVFKQKHPARAFLLEAMGTRTGQTIEIQEEEFLNEPYTNAFFMPRIDDLKASLRWGIIAWLFLPRALSLAAIYMWVVPIGIGLIGYARAWYEYRALARRGEV